MITSFATVLALGVNPLQAKILGAPVKIDTVKVQKLSVNSRATSNGKKDDEAEVYVLKFQQGNSFVPANCITLHFNVNVGTNLEKFTWSQPAAKFGTAEYRTLHFASKGPSCGRGVMAMFVNLDQKPDKKIDSTSDEIACTFTTRAIGKGKYIGRIKAFSTKLKTSINGEFTFTLARS
jgi:hypothetical protein